MDKNHIITIDGPVGSGKSTVGRMLARRQGLIFLDTGAMYRVVALETKLAGLDPDDEAALGRLCEGLEISFKQDGDLQRVFSHGRDVTGEIRTPEISMLASRVSALGAVRKALVMLQRQVGDCVGQRIDDPPDRTQRLASPLCGRDLVVPETLSVQVIEP